jgi:chromate transporter
MEDEFVLRRNWLSHGEFVDLLGAANFIPGPSSTELAMHIGFKQGGLPGLLLAGLCFIFPAALMVSALAYVYVSVGHFDRAQSIMYQLKPVVIAIILKALWGLKDAAWKTIFLRFIAAGSGALFYFGLSQMYVLFAAGVAMMSASFWTCRQEIAEQRALKLILLLTAFLLGFSVSLSVMVAPAVPYSLLGLFLYFLKVGSVTYGSGYVLLAFLRNDLVTHYHWISSTQLLDAIAAGQITPGPVFTTATFIGFLLNGWAGASVATLAIFLPAFILVALSAKMLHHTRSTKTASAFIDGISSAAVALIAVVLMHLAQSALIDLWTILVCLISFVLLSLRKVNPVWLILAMAIIGFFRHI